MNTYHSTVNVQDLLFSQYVGRFVNTMIFFFLFFYRRKQRIASLDDDDDTHCTRLLLPQFPPQSNFENKKKNSNLTSPHIMRVCVCAGNLRVVIRTHHTRC